MLGRTLYVILQALADRIHRIAGKSGSDTDSPYVGCQLNIMAPTWGKPVADVLGADGEFVARMHSLGKLR